MTNIINFPFSKTKEGRKVLEALPAEIQEFAEASGAIDIVDRQMCSETVEKRSGYKTEGSKYIESGLTDVSEIIKLVRKEIKAKYPAKNGWKFSIRKRDYNYINIEIIGSPIKKINPDFSAWLEANPREPMFDAPQKLTDDFKTAYDNIKEILNSYNFDDSDSMTDYFNVNFYSNIGY